MPIDVVMVDDHPLVLAGLDQLLRHEPDFNVIAICTSIEDGWHAIETHRPDLLVLDLMLPDGNGFDLLRRLEGTTMPAVVVLTALQEEEAWLDAARLGARGIVLKATAPRVLEDCLRAVHRGERWLQVGGVDLAERLAQRANAEAELQRALTPRELDVVRLVAQRLDNQEVADRLAISVGTVKIHLHHVYDKLHLQGRQDLLRYLREKHY
jgi:DNA-binding NarL/FixJ family response regulator